MRNLLITLALLATSTIVRAQISLEHTFNTALQTGVLLLSDGSTKIYVRDTGSTTLKLYNTDYTLWKSIAMPIPAGARFYVFSNLSDKLFNTDDAIEVLYSWYFPGTAPTPTTFNLRIINEYGTSLFDLPDGATGYVAYINGIHKLFVTMYINYGILGGYQDTKVYSLPGSLPCGHCGAGSVGVPKTANTSGSTPVAMPNPASGSVSILHGLPIGTTGTLSVIGPDGRTHATLSVSGNEPATTINIANYPQGMYFFTVQNQNGETQSGTFVK